MSVNLGIPEKTKSKLKPRVIVLGVGGGGCNALNTMIASGLKGVEFVACNTDAQSLEFCHADQKIQLGLENTQGLGAGSEPSVGKSAAEESYNEICEYIEGAHMAFIAAGMGGGTGTGAVTTIAKACKEKGILTVAVVTKPFEFEGKLRMDNAEKGIEELREFVDTLIVIPNKNLYIITDETTTYADAFTAADQVLHAGVRSVVDLMMQPGLINLDFADVRSVMSKMGRAVFGDGEASGERKAIEAAESAISNPLLDHVSLEGTKGLLLNITGGPDMTLIEVTEAAERIKQEINDDYAKIIFGSSIKKELDGIMRVSIIATGIDNIVDINAEDNRKEEIKKNNENVLNNKPKTKIAEQTDLEDFTNQIVEIKRNNKDNNISKENNFDDQENNQVKPSNIVLDFIKKLSPLKIFGQNKKDEGVTEEENIFDNEEKKSNEPIIENKKEEDLKIEEETKGDFKIDEKKEEDIKIEENKEEINLNIPENEPNIEKQKIDKEIVNKKEPEIKPLIAEKKNLTEEINKKQKKVEIQGDLTGLDDVNKEKDTSSPKNDKETEEKEDLEIPSFLRNQSN